MRSVPARGFASIAAALVTLAMLTSCVGPGVNIPLASNDLPKCVDDGTTWKAADLATMKTPVSCDPEGIGLEFPDGYVMPINPIGYETRSVPPSKAECPHYAPEYTMANDGTLGLAVFKMQKNPYRIQWWGTRAAVKAEQDAFGVNRPYNDGCVLNLEKSPAPSR